MTRARDIADLAGGGTLLTRQLFTATAGQTTFTPSAGYNPGALEVFMNGLMLLASDYTATNSSTVVLGVAANAGDEVEILTYQINTIGDTISASSGGTISSPITVNRNTTDGDILSFNKDGTTVGSIGVTNGTNAIFNSQGGTLKLGTVGTERYNFDLDQIYPTVDNDTNLGATSHRFRDAYLSGGVYLGGTSSAHRLDDYEVGTWTPSLQSAPGGISIAGSVHNKYVKIGNIVHLQCYVALNTSSSSSAALMIENFPFTPLVNQATAGSMIVSYGSSNTYAPYISGGRIEFYRVDNTGNWSLMNYSNVGAFRAHIGITYQT